MSLDMSTHINYRFFLVLIAGLTVLVAATHGLHAVQINRQSSFLLEQARRARDEKGFRLAVARFRQYTKLVPEDNDAQADLSLLMADVSSPKTALAALEQVLRTQPDRDDVRRRLVK